MSNRIDRVVITGASSGIGLDLARRFLAEGASVVINGRDGDKLEGARRSLGEELNLRRGSRFAPHSCADETEE